MVTVIALEEQGELKIGPYLLNDYRTQSKIRVIVEGKGDVLIVKHEEAIQAPC